MSNALVAQPVPHPAQRPVGDTERSALGPHSTLSTDRLRDGTAILTVVREEQLDIGAPTSGADHPCGPLESHHRIRFGTNISATAVVQEPGELRDVRFPGGLGAFWVVVRSISAANARWDTTWAQGWVEVRKNG